MKVLAYMAEQKARLKAKHAGKEFFFQSAKEKSAPVLVEQMRTSSEILREIDSMKGLNVFGRAMFSRKAKTANEWYKA